jgi:DNA-binding MarR family transcriptional regulator
MLPDLPCACANLRRAARLVTQLYSQEMGPAIEPTQFALLSALEGRAGISQAALGRALGLDKTTLSRSLRLMQKNGWIEPASTGDRRERCFELTRAGEKLLAETKPGWQRAQAKLRATLGSKEWDAMRTAVSRSAEAALAAIEAG